MSISEISAASALPERSSARVKATAARALGPGAGQRRRDAGEHHPADKGPAREPGEGAGPARAPARGADALAVDERRAPEEVGERAGAAARREQAPTHRGCGSRSRG